MKITSIGELRRRRDEAKRIPEQVRREIVTKELRNLKAIMKRGQFKTLDGGQS